jgi:hypothetical protein
MRRKPAPHSEQMTSLFLMAHKNMRGEDDRSKTKRAAAKFLAELTARHPQQARPASWTGGQGTDP